jgi:hypothetical protein
MAFKSLLDPSFTYRNAANTDVGLTFDRIRRELRDKRRPGEREIAEAIEARKLVRSSSESAARG